MAKMKIDPETMAADSSPSRSSAAEAEALSTLLTPIVMALGCGLRPGKASHWAGDFTGDFTSEKNQGKMGKS